jgi:hypothetical protein
MSPAGRVKEEPKNMDNREKDMQDARVADLRVDEGSKELVESPDVQPYIKAMMAMQRGTPQEQALAEISQLPLEKRYLWRVVSALKWAFADDDSESVQLDLDTLTEGDRSKVVKLLRLRPLQFCHLLKVVFGAEGMERIMNEAIKQAKA